MILFNCTNRNVQTVISDKEINVRRVDINITNKMISDLDLLNEMRDILEAFMYQSDKLLITLNALDIAIDNNKELENSGMRYKLFISMLNSFISAGHEIVIFTERDNKDPDLLEMGTIEGIEIIKDSVKLLEYCKTNIL